MATHISEDPCLVSSLLKRHGVAAVNRVRMTIPNWGVKRGGIIAASNFTRKTKLYIKKKKRKRRN